MTRQPHSSSLDEPLADPFADARLDFLRLLSVLQGNDAPSDHADTERYLREHGMELLRKLYQGSLDLGAQREVRLPTPAGTVARLRSRQFQSERYMRWFTGEKASGPRATWRRSSRRTSSRRSLIR